jgi:hypothetical protein
MRVLHITVAALLVLVSPVFAQDTGKAMDHTKHVGEKIHESMVEGYSLAYHLVDLKDKPRGHLMVYIQDPQGAALADSKVGFLIQGPDGAKKRLMADGMKGAYGVNADLSPGGIYVIKMKAVTADGKKLLDSFRYKSE